MAIIAAPRKLVKLLQLYQTLYLRTGRAEAGEIMPAADQYDAWFLDEALPAIEALTVVRQGRWTMEGGPNAITAAGRIVEEGAAKYILGPVTNWTLAHFGEFWQVGWKLWQLNREMFMLPTPRRIRMLPAEADEIAGYQRVELSAWQRHIEAHRRHVERFVHAAMSQGWTREDFRRNMTARDGHIVGFRYGKSDLSWREHLRRYTLARPRLLAQAAAEWRFKHSTEAGIDRLQESGPGAGSNKPTRKAR